MAAEVASVLVPSRRAVRMSTAPPASAKALRSPEVDTSADGGPEGGGQRAMLSLRARTTT